MLPYRLLSFGTHRGEILPDFLGSHDRPWLRDLLERMRSLAAQSERRADELLRSPLGRSAPPGKVRMAAHIARRECIRPSPPGPTPAALRRALFTEAARSRAAGMGPAAPRDARRRVARVVTLSEAQLGERLFADLPGERACGEPPAWLTADELAVRTNDALVTGLLCRARSVRIRLSDHSRHVVRYARLRGLICVARRDDDDDDGLELEISGPLALFRRTRVYGKALSDVVRQLGRAKRWRIHADVDLPGGVRALTLDARDSRLPWPDEAACDSAVEARFERDLRSLCPTWDIRREPPPLQIGTRLIFPDFRVAPGPDSPAAGTARLVEIVGFWTRAYLDRKLSDLRAAGRSDLVVCVDESLACGPALDGLRGDVVAFRRHVDVRRFVDAVWPRAGTPA